MFVAYDFLATNDYTYGRGFDMYTYYFNDPVGAMPSTVTKITAEGTDDTKKNSYTELASHSENILLRPMLTYEREFGRHRVDAVFLYEQRNNHNRYLNATKKGYYSDYPLSISMGDTWHEDGEIAPVTGSFGETASIGVAGRINYAFDRKYLAQFSFRSDATYKFAPENRWGFFPSAAVGWVMSEEKFIKDAGTPINYLKITASYGETGSDDTDAFLYMPKYKMTPSYGYIFGGEGKSVYFTDGFAYRDLTWSTMRTYDAGFEAELWQGKFGIEFKWFYKLTDDILERVGGSYPPSLGGYAPAWKNSGKMDNRGFELVLKHNNRFPNGWAYSLKGTLSWAHNRVLARQIGDDHSVLYQKILGEPLGSIYGLKATGFYQTQEQIDNSPYGPADDKRLGDLMYADINGDGLVSAGDYRDTRYLDYVKIGNSENPEMNFSLNMSVSWKGLSLTTLWYGVAITSYQLASYYNPRGDYIGYPDATMHTRPFYANGNAPYHLVENAWREDNRDAKYPRLSTQFTSTSAWPSSWWVKNGAYLRLRELALSYDLPEKIMSRVGIKGARVTLSGQNLLTFSAYKYVDPEAPSVNNGYYPQRRTYTIGLDLTF